MDRLYEKVIKRYIHVGGKQFLKDLVRTVSLKKSLTHRNMVLIRKNKSEKRRAKVSILQFERDNSHKKRDSHCCLRSLLLKYSEAFLWTVYTVAELKRLCAAYGVNTENEKKAAIGAKLAPVIIASNDVPFSCLISKYTPKLEIGDGRIVLKLSQLNKN